MEKIKQNLLESIVGSIFLPNTGLFLTTIILIISLMVKQDQNVYLGIFISYISCVSLMIFSLIICFLVNVNSPNEILINYKEIIINHQIFEINKINSCEYYVCRWYALPIYPLYKQQAGGLVTIKFENEDEVYFKVLYRDYLIIKKYIKDITLK